MTDDELALALSTLSRGGVVAAATETFFGLLADAREPRALGALFGLKRRSPEKGVALLIPDRAAWCALVTEVPPLAELLADHFWPGPLTVALPASAELDRRLTVDGTVGVRWAGASDAADIAAAFGSPLTATSGNVAGTPPSVTSEDVRSAFAEPVARGELWVVSGSAPGGETSTLVVLRPGRIRESDLVRALPASVLR